MLDDEALLINQAWVQPDAFAGFDIVDVDPREPRGANIARVQPTAVQCTPFRAHGSSSRPWLRRDDG